MTKIFFDKWEKENFLKIKEQSFLKFIGKTILHYSQINSCGHVRVLTKEGLIWHKCNCVCVWVCNIMFLLGNEPAHFSYPKRHILLKQGRRIIVFCLNRSGYISFFIYFGIPNLRQNHFKQWLLQDILQSYEVDPFY